MTTILTTSGNKTLTNTVKAILAIETELTKVQNELAANVDEAKVEKMNSQIQELQGKLANFGLRRATEEERANVLKGITNQDTRRALAPTYLNANACWVEVKVPKPEKVANKPEQSVSQKVKSPKTPKSA